LEISIILYGIQTEKSVRKIITSVPIVRKTTNSIENNELVSTFYRNTSKMDFLAVAYAIAAPCRNQTAAIGFRNEEEGNELAGNLGTQTLDRSVHLLASASQS
jgi:hypothetical protein